MCCLKKKTFDVGIELSCCYLFNICLLLAQKSGETISLLNNQVNKFGPCKNHWTKLDFVFFLFGLLTFRLLAERETFVKTKWWLASSVSLDICFLKKDLWQLCLYLLCTNRWYIYTYIVYICFTISTVLFELSLFFWLSLSFSWQLFMKWWFSYLWGNCSIVVMLLVERKKRFGLTFSLLPRQKKPNKSLEYNCIVYLFIYFSIFYSIYLYLLYIY